MSTIDVDRKARLRDKVRAKGGDLLDCPISGSPGMVAPRLATTFASGDQDQRRQGQRGARRHLRPVGLHRPVRHRGPDEVHRQPAARGAHRGRRRGDGAGPAQRPGPRTRAEDPGQLHRELGHLEAARPPDGRTRLVSRPGPGRTPCTRSWSRSRTTPPRRACPPRCSPPPRRSSTRPWPTAGATSTSPACTIRCPAYPPLGSTNDLVAGQLHRPGRRGLRGAARGRHARRADRAQALVEHAGTARGLARRAGRAARTSNPPRRR